MAQRVLIIDDAIELHRLVRAWLRSDFIELEFTADAEEGYRRAVSEPFDLLLLDVDMPGLGGFEMCSRLKSDPRTLHLPIVFLTAMSSPEDRVAGLNLGAVDYIIKPFHPGEFQARVRAALRTKQFQDLLQERAQTDGLTAMGNRAFLDQRIAALVARQQRNDTPCGCVMLDIDYFKQVNDRFGHQTGDDVLRTVARAVLDAARAEDTAARYGGEEFVLLTPGLTPAQTLATAERLCAQIAGHPVRSNGRTIHITCSAGVSHTEQTPADQLLADADAALYRAKDLGRNRAVCHGQALPVHSNVA